MLLSQSEKNCLRFSQTTIASKYPSKFRDRNFRDQREKHAILKALKYIPKHATILDIPCGSGRLTSMLLAGGFNVVAADRSMPMLELAKTNTLVYRANHNIANDVIFHHADALKTEFNNNAFEATICHRLFHHLIDPDTRKKAIKELNRITSGYMIISFFDSFTLSTKYKNFKRFLLNKKQSDRISLPKKAFIAELESEGLSVIKTIPVLFGISPLTLVVAINKEKQKS